MPFYRHQTYATSGIICYEQWADNDCCTPVHDMRLQVSSECPGHPVQALAAFHSPEEVGPSLF